MVAYGTSQAYDNGQGGMNNRRIVEVQQYITDILLWSIESSSQSSILENELQGTALHTVTDFRKIVTHTQQIPRLCNYSLSPQYHTSLPAASNATLTNAPKTFLFWSPRSGRRLVDRDVGQEIAGFDHKTVMAILKGSREEAARITQARIPDFYADRAKQLNIVWLEYG